MSTGEHSYWAKRAREGRDGDPAAVSKYILKLGRRLEVSEDRARIQAEELEMKNFDLEKLTGINNAPQLVFDVTNIFKEKQRTYFQFDNATFTEYRPGRTYMIGLRGTF